MIAGILMWDIGSKTMVLDPRIAERLDLSTTDYRAVDILEYRKHIVSPNRDIVYERLLRSFQTVEPVVNIYTLRLSDGSTLQVRSRSYWELNETGDPIRLVSMIEEFGGTVQNALEDEMAERVIELRFLAERHADPAYRHLADLLMRELWRRRPPS